MPFLAMKMDSSLPNIENTTARITKKGTFTQTIWTILRYNLVRKRGFHQSLVNLVSTICQGDTNMIKPKQANANIAVLNALGIPKSYSLLTRYVSSWLYRTDRWSWATTNKKTISVSLWFSCESSRSPVFSNSSSRSGVMHSIAFNTFADSISEHYYYHCDVYNQSHDIQTPNSKEPTKVQRF